ncbi:MAG: glutamate-1-semialdehyde 2,1-aminomutase [Deltaproteobacteria bacterium]|nr:glutamate-1-semialdehyde 2,1-aminomutase [Deltaproteobacteria bacterium]
MTKSEEIFQAACRIIPGGVNSPVRACQSVEATPRIVSHGQGGRIFDLDGCAYVDLVSSWGPLILGHAHRAVVQAVNEAAAKGMSFGAPTEAELTLAQKIVEALPSMDMVRLVNSGTEACMSAVRLARGVTGRSKVVKFDGCYHGHADTLLVAAGSGLATLGIPGSPGVPPAVAQETLSLPFNDLERVEEVFAKRGQEIACLIVEPVAGNMGLVKPKPGFLEGLRAITKKHGALLIFDEVITGFRVGWTGAQGLFKIDPDLTCLGKIIGGGLPVGAFGGKAEYMRRLAPEGDIYQAGTLSGNPLATAAGAATLEVLSHPQVYQDLEQKTALVFDGLVASAKEAGVPVSGARVGSMFGLFFTDQEVFDYASAKTADTARYAQYWRSMLEAGVWLAPSQFEVAFLSTAHTQEEMDHVLDSARQAFKGLA